MNIFNIIPLTLLVFFGLFILSKKRKNPSDFVLLIYNLIIILTVLVFDYNFVQNNITGFKLFIHFNSIFWLSSVFLIYVFSLLAKQKTIVVKWWFFTFSLPFIVFSFWDLVVNASPEAVLHQTLKTPNLIYQLFFKLHKVFIIIVCVFLLKQIKTYEVDIKNTFSQIENRSLGWLKNYTIITIGIYASHLITFLLYNFNILSDISLPYIATGIIIIIATLYLSFYGIKFYNYPIQEETIDTTSINNIPQSLNQKTESTETINSSKNVNIHSKSDENKVIFDKVNALFQDEKIFTDADLRIGKVATKINIPVHRVSEAINEQFQKPFYHFVAHYRCESLKEKLQNPQNSNYTILALGMEVGFNSKSSMNRIFKEQTGQTPSQYKKSHLAK